MGNYLIVNAHAFQMGLTKVHRRIASASSKAEANRVASDFRQRGGRALVLDLDSKLIIRDTGKPYGQVWASPSRKGQPIPSNIEV